MTIGSAKTILAAAALAGALLAATTAVAQTAEPNPPTALSPQARAAVIAMAKGPQPPTELAGRRAFLDRFQAEAGARMQKVYAVEVTGGDVAGVPVRFVRPKDKARHPDRVLLNLHGGGFNADSGSLTETIPIADLTGTPVVAVLYRLAPEHVAPAAVDDALAVYRELLKTHAPGQIGVYGTSAGAVLGPQLLMRLRAEGLPQPAVLGMFSGDADLAHTGGSALAQKLDTATGYRLYMGKIGVEAPAASPLLGDLKGFSPTLCMTSTDDFFLSSTSNFCRGLELAGVENKLVAFDGLPHAFWAYVEAPESDQAFRIQAKFLEGHMGGK